MAETTDALLSRLRASGTDLWRLIESCERRKSPAVYVSRAAVDAWEQRAPTAWAAAREWFDAHGVTVTII